MVAQNLELVRSELTPVRRVVPDPSECRDALEIERWRVIIENELVHAPGDAIVVHVSPFAWSIGCGRWADRSRL